MAKSKKSVKKKQEDKGSVKKQAEEDKYESLEGKLDSLLNIEKDRVLSGHAKNTVDNMFKDNHEELHIIKEVMETLSKLGDNNDAKIRVINYVSSKVNSNSTADAPKPWLNSESIKDVLGKYWKHTV